MQVQTHGFRIGDRREEIARTDACAGDAVALPPAIRRVELRSAGKSKIVGYYSGENARPNLDSHWHSPGDFHLEVASVGFRVAFTNQALPSSRAFFVFGADRQIERNGKIWPPQQRCRSA
jgi:hypothetical protein